MIGQQVTDNLYVFLYLSILALAFLQDLPLSTHNSQRHQVMPACLCIQCVLFGLVVRQCCRLTVHRRSLLQPAFSPFIERKHPVVTGRKKIGLRK